MFKSNKQAVALGEANNLIGIRRWALGLLLAGVVSYLLVWSYLRIDVSNLLPITKVRALGDFNYVTEKMLNAALSEGAAKADATDVLGVFEDKGFFNIDVDAIKNRVEKMAWVKRASVQRVWPDTLVIEIAEHKPVAYWGSNGLVNEDGGVFYPDVKTYPKALPVFVVTGAANNAAAEDAAIKCLRYYRDATEVFASINLTITKVKFDTRQALTLSLSSGVNLNVGRQNKLYRLQRFAQVYSTLRDKASLIENIDMRYTNGFSVKWKQHQEIGEQDINRNSGINNV